LPRNLLELLDQSCLECLPASPKYALVPTARPQSSAHSSRRGRAYASQYRNWDGRRIIGGEIGVGDRRG
jgi:hypothetical protein